MPLSNTLAKVLILVEAAVATHQAPVLMYSWPVLMGYGGLMLDVSLFPYAKPSGYLTKLWREDLAFMEPRRITAWPSAACGASWRPAPVDPSW